MTAQYGHYLEPFAKLLLAVAALRDNNRALARELLSGLHNRFPLTIHFYLVESKPPRSAIEVKMGRLFLRNAMT